MRAYNGTHHQHQQGSLLVAERVIGLRVMETTLSRTDRPKTQQAGMLIYGLGSGTEENQLDEFLLQVLQVVQSQKCSQLKKEKKKT